MVVRQGTQAPLSSPASDLRRAAERLIDFGISAETLMVPLCHKDAPLLKH